MRETLAQKVENCVDHQGVSNGKDTRGEAAAQGVVIVHACYKSGDVAGTLHSGAKWGGVDRGEKEAQAKIVAELCRGETIGWVSRDVRMEPEGRASARAAQKPRCLTGGDWNIALQYPRVGSRIQGALQSSLREGVIGDSARVLSSRVEGAFQEVRYTRPNSWLNPHHC
jgi:hypothetical protein